MIAATITISTEYGEIEIEVEVTGVGPRPGTFWVAALEGRKPFVRQTHGGPSQDGTTLATKRQLRGVRIQLEPDAEPAYAWVPEDSFLESAYEARTDIGD